MTGRPRPNFFIVGAPKCGTTAWVEYLSRHPGVFFNPLKETHFFATDFPRYREVVTRDAFLALYERAGQATVLGDGSPMHLRSEAAARNIEAFNPDAKILILLREVGAFVASYHNQELLNGDETDTDLGEVWARSGADRRIPSSCRDPKLLDYKTIGCFGAQVARYLDAFDASQVRVAWMEDWQTDPAGFHRFLLDFLGLEQVPIDDFAPVNAARRHKSRLLARLLHDRTVLKPAIQLARRLGVPPLGIHGRLRQANMASGYDTPAPAGLLAEIRAHYRADAARLDALLAGSGVVYAPPRAAR
jgi:hypothetical protein